MKTRLLALVCRFCPVCVVARLFPRSAFAVKVRAMEKDCPACQAYNQLRAAKTSR